jgi:hypothetical protein
MHTNDVQEILALIAQHKWAMLIAVLGGLLIRLMKQDVDWFFTLPPVFSIWRFRLEARRVRPWFIVALSIATFACERIGSGATGTRAFTDAFIVLVLPIVGHQLGIESLRGGKELPMPKLPPSGGGVGGVLLICCLLMTGCAASFEEARFVGLKTAAPLAKAAAADRTPDEIRYCRELDDARIKHGAAAKALAGFAGLTGSGAGIYGALEQERASRGLLLGGAIGSVVAGAFAAAEFAMAEGAGSAWARDCK